MGEIVLKGYLCERCEHKWPPRMSSRQKPFVCPRCKSPYWNSPRKGKVRKFKDREEHGLFPKEVKRRTKSELWEK